jgi:hypothetical protein
MITLPKGTVTLLPCSAKEAELLGDAADIASEMLDAAGVQSAQTSALLKVGKTLRVVKMGRAPEPFTVDALTLHNLTNAMEYLQDTSQEADDFHFNSQVQIGRLVADLNAARAELR